MAVWSSIAYAGPCRKAAHLSALDGVFSTRAGLSRCGKIEKSTTPSPQLGVECCSSLPQIQCPPMRLRCRGDLGRECGDDHIELLPNGVVETPRVGKHWVAPSQRIQLDRALLVALFGEHQ